MASHQATPILPITHSRSWSTISRSQSSLISEIMLVTLFTLITTVLLTPSKARQITVLNSCSSTVWPGMNTPVGEVPTQATGWELPSKQRTVFEVPDTWTSGRIWARTGCTIQDGKFQCLTGSCSTGSTGEGGDMTCKNSDEPPATLAEFTLTTAGEDNYDISLVDGFNVPLNIYPSISSCTSPSCPTNINPLCPPLLRYGLDQDGKNLGCLAACNVGFGQELYGNRDCCSGGYNNATLCAICGVDYYALFKDNCNTSYAYAYDEKSGGALWTCPASQGNMANYVIEFCPGNSDYVGTFEPGTEYLNATATCSSAVTTFGTTFTVPPSPTKTATIGTLQVVATVEPGIGNAAAYQSYSSSQTSPVASSTSKESQVSSSSLSTSEVVYTSRTLSTARCSKTAEDTTLTLSVEGRTTYIEIINPTSTEPSAAAAVQSITTSKAGQWLQAIPKWHSQKKHAKSPHSPHRQSFFI